MPSSASFFIDREHFADELRVEGGGGLVEEHDLGLHVERPSYRHALLLAAREPDRVLVGLFTEPHLLKQIPAPLGRLLLGLTLDCDGGFDEVLHHGEMGEQIEVLKHHARLHAYLTDGLGPLLGDVAGLQFRTVDLDAAPGGGLEEIDAAQQGALARAGASEDNHNLARANVHRDVL